MYTLYILKCSDGSLYTGIAKDLESRLEQHRTGAGSKYVRTRLPFQLVYTKRCRNRSSAQKQEYKIKQLSRQEKIKLISL